MSRSLQARLARLKARADKERRTVLMWIHGMTPDEIEAEKALMREDGSLRDGDQLAMSPWLGHEEEVARRLALMAAGQDA